MASLLSMTQTTGLIVHGNDSLLPPLFFRFGPRCALPGVLSATLDRCRAVLHNRLVGLKCCWIRVNKFVEGSAAGLFGFLVFFFDPLL